MTLPCRCVLMYQCILVILGLVTVKTNSTNCTEIVLIDKTHFGTAKNCPNLYLWGVQGSGSTFAWQILNAVVKRVRGSNATTVIKGHYLNRLIRDHNLPADASSKNIPCLAATYRDFRDVLCSHARRGGSGGIKQCLDCDATTLESSKSVVMMLGKLFSKGGGQAAELIHLQNRGALLLRYEHYVGCADALINAYADWLGVDLKTDRNVDRKPISELGSKDVDEMKGKETYDQWRLRILEETSMSSNMKRADSLKTFSRYNPDTGIHGGHISNKGAVGGWRDCMTDSVRQRVAQQLKPFLSHFNYSLN